MRKHALILILTFVLAIILCGAVNAASNVVKVGQTTVFTNCTEHSSSFGNTINPPNLPWPDSKSKSSSGNSASVSTSASTNQGVTGTAAVGCSWIYDIGSNSWDEVKNLPVKITVDLSYTMSASYTNAGSSAAGLDIPEFLDASSQNKIPGKNIIDVVPFGSPGSKSQHYIKSFTTNQKGETLTVSKIKSVTASAWCYAIAPKTDGSPSTASSYSSVTINSIKIEFLPIKVEFDKDLYSDLDSAAWVKVTDPSANVNKSVRDSVMVKVRSFRTENGSAKNPAIDEISLKLTETGVNTGVFRGGFVFDTQKPTRKNGIYIVGTPSKDYVEGKQWISKSPVNMPVNIQTWVSRDYFMSDGIFQVVYTSKVTDEAKYKFYGGVKGKVQRVKTEAYKGGKIESNAGFVSSANVWLIPVGKKTAYAYTKTDSCGNYKFTNIKPGKYNILISIDNDLYFKTFESELYQRLIEVKSGLEPAEYFPFKDKLVCNTITARFLENLQTKYEIKKIEMETLNIIATTSQILMSGTVEIVKKSGVLTLHYVLKTTRNELIQNRLEFYFASKIRGTWQWQARQAQNIIQDIEKTIVVKSKPPT